MPSPTGNASSSLSGKPPVVDRATWEAARDELLVREKAHMHEGDAIAAARRLLPMVEIDGTVEVTGANGPVPFLDLFEGRDELAIYQHMWYDGAPSQGQCEGCTTTAWHLRDAAYLRARGVAFAIVTVGEWDEVARFVGFMGYTEPWYSVRGVPAPIGGVMGHLVCFLRDGDRVFLTYSTSGRGNEAVNGSLGLLDMTPYGRREGWQDDPDRWPRRSTPARPSSATARRSACHGARTPAASPTGARRAAPPRSGPAPAPPPRRPWAARALTTDAAPSAGFEPATHGLGNRCSIP